MFNEMIILFVTAFIIIPTTVETHNCMHPKPEGRDGIACNWNDKVWEEKFHMPSKTHYLRLKEVDETDNFIEKRMRIRYHRKLNEKLEQWTANPNKRRLAYLKQKERSQ